MGAQVDTQKTLMARENFYRFLSRLYLLEVDEALLSILRVMELPPQSGNAALDEGYQLLKQAASALTADGLDELAVDYARVFLAAGIAEGGGAFPYESVYQSRLRMSHQQAQSGAAAWYAEEGISLVQGPPDVPEDHVAAELDFMAYLCGNAQMDGAYLQKQRDFFRQHIASWMPRFAVDVVKYAETDFYKAVGKLTTGFIQMEESYLKQ